MVPMLDEMDVPYEVLDARAESLDAARLSSGSVGHYNGIVLTEAVLYDPASATGSAFTAGEWGILHDYERAFQVRESVISGFPGTYPQFGLDYGMTDIEAGAPFTGRWVAPAGVDVFAYVNTAQTLPITDYAVHSHPLQLYTGQPADSPDSPTVQPLLVLDADPSRTFVSILRYDDGREVLLSSITNAPYLIYSQVLAYEFLNYATRGVFIGGRFAYLAAHVDDLFIGDSLWDPATNRTIDDNISRLDGTGFTNAVHSQDALRSHPTTADFTLDFPFNGVGAQTAKVPSMILTSVADTDLREHDPVKNFGTDSSADINLQAGSQERAVFRFDVPANHAPLRTATLTLRSDDQRLDASLCPVTTAWDEGIKKDNQDASWRFARTGIAWTSAGGDFDPTACQDVTLPAKASVSVDATSIVSGWVAGARPNDGFILRARGTGNGRIKTREDGNPGNRPSLRLDFDAVVDASGQVIVPDVALPTTADTFLRQSAPTTSSGTAADANVKLKADGTDEKHALLGFGVTSNRLPGMQTATLDLYTEGALINAQVCPVVDTRWEEATATWSAARTSVPWHSGPGGDYDAAYCQPFRFVNGARVQIDVTDIVEAWQDGDLADFGLVVRPLSVGEAKIKTKEEPNPDRHPLLRLSFQPVTPDSLTAAAKASPTAFRYISHTFSHRNMDSSQGTTYDEASYEIEQNRQVWDLLGLPGRPSSDQVLVSGEHSGLADGMGTDDPADDIPYPTGRNDEFLRAAHDEGIAYLASDASRPNQSVEGYVPTYGELLLPRLPTAVFYNVTDPQTLTDEYNYIFHDRYVDAGQDPCTIPAAICTPRSYDQIVAAEADIGVRQILSYRPWPHFFHESNLHQYDGSGSTLLFDWLQATIDRYEALFTLPLKNLPYYEIGRQTADRVAARAANVRGVLDLGTGRVTLVADSDVRPLVTGLATGELYGGQRIGAVGVGVTPTTFDLAP